MHTDSTGRWLIKPRKLLMSHCSFQEVEEEPLQREVKVLHSAYMVWPVTSAKVMEIFKENVVFCILKMYMPHYLFPQPKWSIHSWRISLSSPDWGVSVDRKDDLLLLGIEMGHSSWQRVISILEQMVPNRRLKMWD